MNNFNQAHLADYLKFNCRRLLANIFHSNDGSMSSESHDEAIRWRALSSLLLMPIWSDLDQYATSYVQEQWATLGDDLDSSVVYLMLARDFETESDWPMATEEAKAMCRNGQLIHQYVELEDDTIALQVDTASVMLNRFGIVDPRLAFGACLHDARPSIEVVHDDQCQCHHDEQLLAR